MHDIIKFSTFNLLQPTTVWTRVSVGSLKGQLLRPVMMAGFLHCPKKNEHEVLIHPDFMYLHHLNEVIFDYNALMCLSWVYKLKHNSDCWMGFFCCCCSCPLCKWGPLSSDTFDRLTNWMNLNGHNCHNLQNLCQDKQNIKIRHESKTHYPHFTST